MQAPQTRNRVHCAMGQIKSKVGNQEYLDKLQPLRLRMHRALQSGHPTPSGEHRNCDNYREYGSNSEDIGDPKNGVIAPILTKDLLVPNRQNAFKRNKNNHRKQKHSQNFHKNPLSIEP